MQRALLGNALLIGCLAFVAAGCEGKRSRATGAAEQMRVDADRGRRARRTGSRRAGGLSRYSELNSLLVGARSRHESGLYRLSPPSLVSTHWRATLAGRRKVALAGTEEPRWP
jgi:hypothetical protein